MLLDRLLVIHARNKSPSIFSNNFLEESHNSNFVSGPVGGSHSSTKIIQPFKDSGIFLLENKIYGLMYTRTTSLN